MADKVIGQKIILYYNNGVSDTAFACSTNCTFNVTVDQKEVTSQTSNWFREYKIDVSSWTVTCEGLVTLSGFSYADMLAKQLARTPIIVKFSINNGALGFVVLTGTANIVSLDLSGPYKEVATYNIALQGIGAYTIS